MASLMAGIASAIDAEYGRRLRDCANRSNPMVTWASTGAFCGISQPLPEVKSFAGEDRNTAEHGYEIHGPQAGRVHSGHEVDVPSWVPARIRNLRLARGRAVDKGNKVHPGVRMLVVPGSQQVKQQAEEEGLHEIFTEAGAEWREAGCSMCLGMNPDKLVGAERSISTSNRNFIGRQGSPRGRTPPGQVGRCRLLCDARLHPDPKRWGTPA